MFTFFFFSSRRRHTRFDCDWSSDVCSSDLDVDVAAQDELALALHAHQVLVHFGQEAELGRLAQFARAAAGKVGADDGQLARGRVEARHHIADRKSTRLNSSHSQISYAVFCLKKKNKTHSACHGPWLAMSSRL